MLISSNGANVKLREAISGRGSRGGWFASASAAGESMTKPSALSIPAFYAAATLLAKTAGTLPIQIVSQDGRDRVESGDLYNRLNTQANEYATASATWSSLFLDLIVTGNAYALVLPAADGLKASELFWMPSDGATVWVDEAGDRRYDFATVDASAGLRGVHSSYVLHAKSFSINTALVGASPIDILRDSLGVSRGAVKRRASGMNNKAVPSGILTSPNVLTQPQLEQARDMWQSAYGGANNEGKVAVLHAGLSFNQLNVSNRDQQFIEQLSQGATESASTLSVPPSMIGAEGSAMTYDNAASNNEHFLRYSLRPYLTFAEEAMLMHNGLFGIKGRYRPRFDTSEINRPIKTERYDLYEKGINGGWLTVEEARDEEARA